MNPSNNDYWVRLSHTFRVKVDSSPGGLADFEEKKVFQIENSCFWKVVVFA